jgi:hypothetical protein
VPDGKDESDADERPVRRSLNMSATDIPPMQDHKHQSEWCDDSASHVNRWMAFSEKTGL